MTSKNSIALAFGLSAVTSVIASPVSVSSPNGRLMATLSDNGGNIRYTVSLDGTEVLAPSVAGIRSDGIAFGKEGQLGTPEIRKVNETYPFSGAKSVAVNRARVAIVPASTQGQQYKLDLHVADDGVGVRLRLPAKAGRKVEADLSTWQLPGDPAVWAMEHSDCYEEKYQTKTLSGLGNQRYGLPLTARVGNAYLTLSEAALTDYSDLEVNLGESKALVGSLPHDAKGWTTDRAVIQPWRVTIVASGLTELVNTTLIQNLNPPADPALANAKWIKPGRSTWQWLNSGSPKFEEQHQWVDWTKSLGFEYYLVDDGWKKWPNNWEGLKSVCDYAKKQGVGVWLWVHSNEVKDPQSGKDYFRRAVDAGIVGVKVDFPLAPDRSWATWYQDTAKEAAEQKLMIDFHGAVKPTGMERTWPNELTREGVRGHEWHTAKHPWVPERILEPQHDVILAFTRYIVGPGDYTPTVLEPADIHGNTYPHELAQAIVFTSPFLCFGGNPKTYLENPAKDLISAIPSTWDQTVVLPASEPGKLAAFARRRGNQWFVGVLNGADPATIDIPLTFLGQGSWKASVFEDVDGKPDSFKRSERPVAANASLKTNLLPRGGFVMWIRK
ncbi:MAG: glycoside hydrolase family 97 catalytic domain-containing protein [Verrucomicrobiota bacterium]